MYPTDAKELAAARLVATIAGALASGAPVDLRPLYDQLELQPSTVAAWHAATAAVRLLLDHQRTPALNVIRHIAPPPACQQRRRSKSAAAGARLPAAALPALQAQIHQRRFPGAAHPHEAQERGLT